MNKKEIPLGINIISIFYYLIATFVLVYGLIGIFGMFVGWSGLMSVGLKLLGLFLGILFVVLPFTLLFFFIGRDLRRAKKTARIVALVIAIFGLVGALGILFLGNYQGIFGLIVNGLIAGYLLFSKEVKKFFS